MRTVVAILVIGVVCFLGYKYFYKKGAATDPATAAASAEAFIGSCIKLSDKRKNPAKYRACLSGKGITSMAMLVNPDSQLQAAACIEEDDR